MIDPNFRILVIDPMTTVANSVADQLREIGFSYIDQLHSGLGVQDYLARARYGLVLSEWELGGVSGLDLLKSVRSNPLTKSLPFLLMTSELEVDRVIAARQAGVSGYLVKPFSISLLKQKLTSILSEA